MTVKWVGDNYTVVDRGDNRRRRVGGEDTIQGSIKNSKLEEVLVTVLVSGSHESGGG